MNDLLNKNYKRNYTCANRGSQWFCYYNVLKHPSVMNF